MKLYCGIDLHSNNHWLTLINEQDERLVEERLANDLAVTLAVLARVLPHVILLPDASPTMLPAGLVLVDFEG
jgi:hypothetical protein